MKQSILDEEAKATAYCLQVLIREMTQLLLLIYNYNYTCLKPLSYRSLDLF